MLEVKGKEMNAKHIRMIEQEYAKACEKHPKFCDAMTYHSHIFFKLAEEKRKAMQGRNGHYYAEFILDEEIQEAFEAYTACDREHCLQELAQCGAVILRMMQYVEEERWANGDTCKGSDNEKEQS